MLTINDSGFLFFGILVFNIFALYFICLDSCPWEVCVLSWFACFCNFLFCNLYFCIFLSLREMKMGKSLQSMAVFSLPLGTALSSEGHFSCQRESGWDYLYPKYHPTVIGKLVTIFALFFAIWFKLCWCKFYDFVCCLIPAVFAEIHVQVCCLFYICMSLVLFVVWLQPCSLLIWNLWSNPWREGRS